MRTGIAQVLEENIAGWNVSPTDNRYGLWTVCPGGAPDWLPPYAVALYDAKADVVAMDGSVVPRDASSPKRDAVVSFVLLHELAHRELHRVAGGRFFFEGGFSDIQVREIEADQWALERLHSVISSEILPGFVRQLRDLALADTSSLFFVPQGHPTVIERVESAIRSVPRETLPPDLTELAEAAKDFSDQVSWVLQLPAGETVGAIAQCAGDGGGAVAILSDKGQIYRADDEYLRMLSQPTGGDLRNYATSESHPFARVEGCGPGDGPPCSMVCVGETLFMLQTRQRSLEIRSIDLGPALRAKAAGRALAEPGLLSSRWRDELDLGEARLILPPIWQAAPDGWRLAVQTSPEHRPGLLRVNVGPRGVTGSVVALQGAAQEHVPVAFDGDTLFAVDDGAASPRVLALTAAAAPRVVLAPPIAYFHQVDCAASLLALAAVPSARGFRYVGSTWHDGVDSRPDGRWRWLLPAATAVDQVQAFLSINFLGGVPVVLLDTRFGQAAYSRLGSRYAFGFVLHDRGGIEPSFFWQHPDICRPEALANNQD